MQEGVEWQDKVPDGEGHEVNEHPAQVSDFAGSDDDEDGGDAENDGEENKGDDRLYGARDDGDDNEVAENGRQLERYTQRENRTV